MISLDVERREAASFNTKLQLVFAREKELLNYAKG